MAIKHDSPKEKFDGDRQHILDYSSFKVLEQCDYKYKLQILERWTYPEQEVYHKMKALFGSALHSGLEMYDEGKLEGRSRFESFMRCLENLYEHKDLLDLCFKHKGDKAYTFGSVVRAAAWYFDHYWDNDPATIIRLPNGDSPVEARIEYPLPNSKHRTSGKIDSLVTDPFGTWVLDRKTTGMTLDNKFITSNYMPSLQFCIYPYFFRQFLGLDVDGVVVDAIQLMVGGVRFKRFHIPVPYEVAEQAVADMGAYAEETIKRNIKNDHWPQKFSACHNKWNCMFTEVCFKTKGVRDELLKSNFVQKERKDAV